MRRSARFTFGAVALLLALSSPSVAAADLQTPTAYTFRAPSADGPHGLASMAAGLAGALLTAQKALGLAPSPHHFIRPSVAFDIGPYVDTSANDVLRRFLMVPEDSQARLDNLGFSLVRAAIGLELGDPGRLVLFARAGISRWSFDRGPPPNRARETERGSAAVQFQRQQAFAVLTPMINGGFVLRF
jgi:hypothetical protein